MTDEDTRMDYMVEYIKQLRDTGRISEKVARELLSIAGEYDD